MDSNLISEILGIQPDDSQKKGERRGGLRPNSKAYVTRIGTWRIHLKTESRTVLELVDEMLQKFDDCQESLNNIKGVDEAYLDVFIIQDRKDKVDNTVEFIMSKEQILRASQLGLALSVTITINDDKQQVGNPGTT